MFIWGTSTRKNHNNKLSLNYCKSSLNCNWILAVTVLTFADSVSCLGMLNLQASMVSTWKWRLIRWKGCADLVSNVEDWILTSIFCLHSWEIDATEKIWMSYPKNLTRMQLFLMILAVLINCALQWRRWTRLSAMFPVDSPAPYNLLYCIPFPPTSLSYDLLNQRSSNPDPNKNAWSHLRGERY